MITKAIFLLSVAILTGCASITIRTNGPMSDRVDDPRYDFPTPIYAGVASDFIEMGKGLAAPVRCRNNPKVDWYDICVVPFALIDAPLSFVVDTICLPFDIAFWPEWAADVPGKRFRSGEEMRAWMEAIDRFEKLSRRLPTNLREITTVRKSNDPQMPPLLDPWGHEYSYIRITSTGYAITSVGEDGIQGTGDDMIFKGGEDVRFPANGATGKEPGR